MRYCCCLWQGMAPTSLIRGVIFHLPTLLRASSAPFKRAAAVSLSDTSEGQPHAGRERRVLSEEEELERRVRMEVMGGGGGLRDQQQDGGGGGGMKGMVEGLARALGVGMQPASGGEVPDPRSTPVRLHTPSPTSGYAAASHEPANLFNPKKAAAPVNLRPGVSRPAPAGGDQLRAKYLAKVREKTGKVLAPQGGGMNEKAMDEAERRLTARRLVQGTEAQTGAGGSSSTSLSLSVLDILHYVKWRGLRTCLLLGTRRHESPDLSALLGRHRRDLDFDCITPTTPEEEKEEEGWEGEEVRWAIRRLSLDPNKTLVVADDKAALEGARALGCFTCRVEGTSGGSGGSYAIATLDEVKTVIEDLNGVSMRQRDSLL